jgi:sulfite reductase alpha subunit-like flavoprotein
MHVIEDYLKCIASQAAVTAESCNDHCLMTSFVVQVVQHIELSIEGSGLQYRPGDLLVTLPQQSHSAGEEFLRRMGVATGACMHGYRRHTACSSPPKILSKVCRMSQQEAAL